MARVHKAHLKQSDPRCDTVVVLNMARKTASKAADMNAIRCLDGDLNLHWADNMPRNHFNHYKAGRFSRVKPVTARQARRPVSLISVAEAKKYRKRVGRRWVRPFTVAERQRQANRRGVKIFWELKSRDYGAKQEYADRFVRSLRAVGGKWAVMTLITMANWGPKLLAFAQAGADTNLMMHGVKRTPARMQQIKAWQTRGAIKGFQ